MTALERKERSIAQLEKLGIPFISHLPCIEEESVTRIRTGPDIARRILVLDNLVYLAGEEEEEDKSKVLPFLKKEGLWKAASAKEKKLFRKGTFSAQERLDTSWRSESIWLMLWAIQKVEHIGLPVADWDSRDDIEGLPGFLESPHEFIESVVCRPAGEILDMSDLLYRMHWAVRQAWLEGKEAPAGLHQGIVYEWHYAINWLTFYGEHWDDISTDT